MTGAGAGRSNIGGHAAPEAPARPDTAAPQNGLALCGSATTGCHGWVESNRTEAETHGWAVDQNADPLLKPVDHHLHGWIYLYANGSWGSRPEEATT